MRLYSKNLAAMLMGLALLAFQVESGAQSRGGSQSSRSSRPSTSASSSSSPTRSSSSSSRPSTSSSQASSSRPDNKPKADISPANRNPSKPSNNVTRPTTKPADNKKPSGNVTKPAGNNKPSGNSKPSGNVSKPSGNPQRPSGNVNRPAGAPHRPSDNVHRPSGAPHKPSGSVHRPSKPAGPAPIMKPGVRPQNHWRPGVHYYGHRVKVLPARARSYFYSGRTYYILDDVWYRLNNGYYVVCRPPFGTVLAANLIADIVWNAVRFSNNVAPQASYFYQDGVFYTLGADGRYYVIVPPIGALVERLPDDYEVISIQGNEYYRVDDTIYQLTISDGQPYFEVVGQVD